jgi:hypothetical protein
MICNDPVACPVTPPFDPTSLIIDLVGFFLQALGLGAPDLSVLSHAINNSWLNLVLSSSFLYNAIGAITDFFKRLLLVIVGGIAHIISDILHGHLKKVLEDIQALLHALHNLFAPLIAWLRKLQAIQRQYQLQTLRHLVNLIQRARQILVVFRLLHLKFAQKLDNWLAGIEGKIITREIDIARKTNEILGWVNFVADPFGALRGAAVFGPIGTLLRSLAAAAHAVNLEKVFPQLTRHPGPNGSTVPWQHFVDTYQVERATTSGAYGDFHRGTLRTVELLKGEYNT